MFQWWDFLINGDECFLINGDKSSHIVDLKNNLLIL